MLAAAALAVEIAVLTMTPGPDLFARFGHAAIRVDDGSGEPRVYNYGTYSSRDPELFKKFLHNEIEYWLGVSGWELFRQRYAGRDMTIQKLRLDAEQTERMVHMLERNATPERRRYKYDWFRRNCATKLRDAVDFAVAGQMKKQLSARPAQRTIRGVLERVLEPIPTTFRMMSLGLNARVDAPINRYEELAMPIDLQEALREVTVADGPLVSSEELIPASAAPPRREPPWLVPAVAGLLLGLLALGALRVRRGPALAGLGLMGWGLLGGLVGWWCIAWTLLPYEDTRLSANLLAWNPILVAAVVVGWRRLRGRLEERERILWARILAAIAAAALVELGGHAVGVGRQAHLHYALYAIAANGLGALSLWRAS